MLLLLLMFVGFRFFFKNKIIFKIFDVDPKLVENQLLSTWERCIKSDLRNSVKNSQFDSNFNVEVPEYDFDSAYGANEVKGIKFENKALNDEYLKSIIEFLKTGKLQQSNYLSSGINGNMRRKDQRNRYFNSHHQNNNNYGRRAGFGERGTMNYRERDNFNSSANNWASDSLNNDNNHHSHHKQRNWRNNQNNYSSSSSSWNNNFNSGNAGGRFSGRGHRRDRFSDQNFRDNAPRSIGQRNDERATKMSKMDTEFSESDNEKDNISAYTVDSSDSENDMNTAKGNKRKGSKIANDNQNMSRREKLLNQLREAEEAVAGSK